MKNWNAVLKNMASKEKRITSNLKLHTLAQHHAEQNGVLVKQKTLTTLNQLAMFSALWAGKRSMSAMRLSCITNT